MNSALTTSAILDSRSKLSIFSDESKPRACKQIQSVFNLYKERFSSFTNLAPPTPIKKNDNILNYFSKIQHL